MSLLENIRLAMAGLRSGKMRALLTMLGIIIGIGSVIAIVTIGSSMTSSITDSMSSMGLSNINVNLRQKGSQQRGPGGAPMAEADKITPAMIDAMIEEYPDEIETVSLSQSAGNGTAKDGRLYANVSITGANDGYLTANSITLEDGRFIMDRDIDGSRNVAVVSDKLAAALFAGEDPLEKTVKVYTDTQILNFIVVGIYKYESTGMGDTSAEEDIRTNLYIPVTTAKKISNTGSGYQSFTAVINQDASPTEMATEIQDFFTRYYGDSSKFTVSASSMETMVENVTSMMSTVSIAIAAIAAISLLVGGIGVMNIMLVSVTERTREIGTRKALGARNSAIRMQFVVESIIICMIGGLIGVLFGFVLGKVGSSLLGYPAGISIPVSIIAVAFSMVIGVFFGYYPAGKAAKLDPIEALRYE